MPLPERKGTPCDRSYWGLLLRNRSPEFQAAVTAPDDTGANETCKRAKCLINIDDVVMLAAGERTAQSGGRRMRFRSRFAIVAITAALTAGMLAVVGVAVPVSAAARTQVTPSAADPHEFQSVGNDGEYITGDTHGGDLYLSDGGTSYDLYSKGGNTFAISAGGYCWNAVPEATAPVEEDSCQSSDTNEWFTFVFGEGNDNILIQQYSSGLFVTAVDGKIDLDDLGGPADNQTWIEH